jgi:ankyrin repeat protein
MRHGALLLSVVIALAGCNSKSQPHLDAALYSASLRGNVAEVDRLIAAGANVNSRSAENSDETPLHPAVDKDHVEVVRHLLRAGANPELRNRQDDRPIDFLQGQRYDTDECKLLLKAAAASRAS